MCGTTYRKKLKAIIYFFKSFGVGVYFKNPLL